MAQDREAPEPVSRRTPSGGSSLRDRILTCLRHRRSSATAPEILIQALNIRSPNSAAAERLLRSIVGKDRRFRHAAGRWSAASCRTEDREDRSGRIAALCLQRSSRSSPRQVVRGAMSIRIGADESVISFSEDMNAADRRALGRARRMASSCLLITYAARELRGWNLLLRRCGLAPWEGPHLTLLSLYHRLYPGAGANLRLDGWIALLGLTPRDVEDPRGAAELYLESFLSLRDRIPAELLQNPEALSAWSHAGEPRVDFSRFGFDRAYLAGLPESPGVYLMRNRAGDILYVGKARNLRRRLRSYFTPRALRDPKVTRMHEQLHSIETIRAASEVEALLVEMKLIRDFQPPINLQSEVHEKPARYGRSRNLIFLVPQADAAAPVLVYFIRDSRLAAEEQAPLGRAPGRKLARRIRTLYFAPPGEPELPGRNAWEIEIISRWLLAQMRALNFVDVDEAGDAKAVLRLLGSYLSDADRLSVKVYYR